MTSPVPSPAGDREGSPSAPVAATNTFRFGPFLLSVERFELARDGVPLDLPAVPLEILLILLRHDGHLVTRLQIARAIWPESDPADVTHRINTAINRIRTTLGDNPAEPAYIQTVIGRGYRFIGTLLPSQPEATPQTPPQTPFTAPPESQYTPSPRRWLVAAAFSTLALAILVVVSLVRSRFAQHSSSPDFRATQFTFNQSENRVTAAAISPDGTRVAYADADGVRLKTLSQVDSSPVPTPANCVVSHLAWSPDGQHLIISAVTGNSEESDAWLLSVDGDPPRLLERNAWRATPAPAGTALAYADSTHAQLWVLDRPDAAPRMVLRGSKDDTFPVFAWTPSGLTLLVERLRGLTAPSGTVPGQPADPSFSLLALDTVTGQITATRNTFRMDDALISSTGTLLFSREQPGGLGIWTASLQPGSSAILSAPQLRSLTPKDARSFSMSAAGTIATVIQTRIPGAVVGDFEPAPPAIANAQPLSFSSQEIYPHSWSPDSRDVYFEARQDSNSFRIFRQTVGAHDAVALAQSPNDQAFPLVSPDGHWILFEGRNRPNDPYAWFRVPAQGGTAQRLPLTGPAGELRCPLTGRQCVLRRPNGSGANLFYQLDPEQGLGKLLRSFPQNADGQAAWDLSPDGSKLAFLGADRQHPELIIAALAAQTTSTVPIPLHEPVMNLHWSANARGWLITTHTDIGSDIFFLKPDGTTTLLRQTSGPSWADPSPDGRKLVFVDQRNESNVWLLTNTLATLPQRH